MCAWHFTSGVIPFYLFLPDMACWMSVHSVYHLHITADWACYCLKFAAVLCNLHSIAPISLFVAGKLCLNKSFGVHMIISCVYDCSM